MNNGLSFRRETESVHCAVRTGCLNVIQATVHLFCSVLTRVKIRLLCEGHCSHFQFTHMCHSAPYQNMALSAPRHFCTLSFLSVDARNLLLCCFLSAYRFYFALSSHVIRYSSITRHNSPSFSSDQHSKAPFPCCRCSLQYHLPNHDNACN